MNFKFGSYEVITDTRELLHEGIPQSIEPLIFKLLLFMLENPDRVLSRDELIETVWESRIISDSALSASISAARHVIGDAGNTQKCIKTISGSGYRFIAEFTCDKNPITIRENESQATHFPFEELQEALVLPDKPSIAVLDFMPIGNSEDGVFLAAGLTTEINSALARLPHFFVIARSSASILSQQSFSSKKIGQHLGVRYLLYGTLEQAARRIRVTFSIVDATQDTEIWSEHFDRSLDDIFQVKDDISNAIVRAADITIEQAEIERAFLIPTEDLSAWGNYHRGLEYKDRTNLKDVEIAHDYFEKAVTQDTRFSRAYAGLAYTYTNRCLLDHKPIKDTDSNMRKSMEYAQRSIDLCGRESMGYVSLGRATLYINKIEKGLSLINQAIAYYPNYTHSLILKAQAISRLDVYDKQLDQSLDLSLRLNPHCRMDGFIINMVRAMTMFHKKQYDKADNFILRSFHYNDSYYLAYALAAACQQKVGKEKEAQQYMSKALELLPNCTLDSCERLMPEAKELRETITQALLDSGMPEAN